MHQFRIKKEEKWNGECQWTPQVGTPRLTVGRYLYLKLDWENILEKSLTTSKTQKYSYPSEEQALQIIEEFKQYRKEQDSKKVVKVSYKNL